MTEKTANDVVAGLEHLDGLEERCEAIADRLRRRQSPEQLQSLKREIVEFFHDVDTLHGRVDRLRERIRGLVNDYRRQVPATDKQRAQPVRRSDSLNTSSLVERAWSLIAAERFAEAVAALEKALSLSPTHVEAQGLLAWALMKSGNLERALESIGKVLVADPDNEIARVNLGYVSLAKQSYIEAERHLRRALELGRDRRATLYALLYLGMLHEERGDSAEAWTWYKRAIETGPNLIEAYYRLGLLLHRDGRVEQARAVWEKAVARNRYDPHSRRARERLDELASGRPVTTF